MAFQKIFWLSTFSPFQTCNKLEFYFQSTPVNIIRYIELFLLIYFELLQYFIISSNTVHQMILGNHYPVTPLPEGRNYRTTNTSRSTLLCWRANDNFVPEAIKSATECMIGGKPLGTPVTLASGHYKRRGGNVE